VAGLQFGGVSKSSERFGAFMLAEAKRFALRTTCKPLKHTPANYLKYTGSINPCKFFVRYRDKYTGSTNPCKLFIRYRDKYTSTTLCQKSLQVK
jgi:hypothetical protein